MTEVELCLSPWFPCCQIVLLPSCALWAPSGAHPHTGSSKPCLPDQLSGGFFQGGLYRDDGLQKEDAGEGEVLTLVETALGQSRSLAKAWSHQLCAVKLWLFSGFPSVIFTRGREHGQVQTLSQIAYT